MDGWMDRTERCCIMGQLHRQTDGKEMKIKHEKTREIISAQSQKTKQQRPATNGQRYIYQKVRTVWGY